MAYVSKEIKAEIKAELDKVVPKEIKYSLRVHNHSTIVMTIRSGNVDFYKNRNDKVAGKLDYFNNPIEPVNPDRSLDVNRYHVDKQFDGEVLALLEKIIAALNIKNWDRSDIQSDYFDVGYYVDLKIGSWDKPYILNN